jgi:succinate dehydrogenase (ubiquinone) cytochrome b560 subunit
VGATVSAIAATNAFLLFPFKFAVSYTILYHWLGGLRHIVWDHHKIGNQVWACMPVMVCTLSVT